VAATEETIMTADQNSQGTGNSYGTVADDKGDALPGVTVTLSGNGAPQLQVTDAQGQFRFLGLQSGTYQLKAELDGFSMLGDPKVVIDAGRDTETEVRLNPNIQA
jgi:hypothetical protein